MNASNKYQYNIGAVARLTQIHPETIRVWERRYQLVVPERSDTGRRMYSDEDIGRLLLVKQLIELGNAVSGLANLSNEELRNRLTTSQSKEINTQPHTNPPCRVLFIDEPLKIRLGRDLSMYSDIEVLDAPPRDNMPALDALIVGLATLNKESHLALKAEAEKAGCKSVITVYSFGQPSVVKELTQAGIICLKSPIGAADIRDACKSINKSSASKQTVVNSKAAPRRFSEEHLAKVAMMKGSIACECPNHLAELIINLCAFEQYSSDCENTNPDDAAVHAQLSRATAQARTILEDSLARLIEIEGIKI
jgi:hypothetical protein